jgi:glycosyltransferase involved in cell wall biosynthesis
MKILILTKYGRLGASSRMRFIQYFPYLEENSIQVDHFPLITDEMLQYRYKTGRYNKYSVLSNYWRRIKLLAFKKNQYDLIWIEGEAFPFFPAGLELLLLKGSKYVVDYDDAIFHRYDMNKYWFIRLLLGKRIDRIMKHSDLVVAGNDYIAERALKAGAENIEVLPTVIDLNRYSEQNTSSNLPVVGWVGSPTTSGYLTSIESALIRLSNELPFELWVIGGDYSNKDLNVKLIPWSEETEVELIQKFDIGIMPLFNSPWERGKCGYKLIQYMACGKPLVASPIGVNEEIVSQSGSGFLALTENDWFESLHKLLSNKNVSSKHGMNGLRAVSQKYCIQVTSRELLNFFKNIPNKKRI